MRVARQPTGVCDRDDAVTSRVSNLALFSKYILLRYSSDQDGAGHYADIKKCEGGDGCDAKGKITYGFLEIVRFHGAMKHLDICKIA